MRTWSSSSAASPNAAWHLLSRPEAWSRWAPHVRGAWGLGAPEVRTGAVGAARLLGVVPVPAKIVSKRAGRSWTWQVGFGLVEMAHRVEPREDGGCVVSIDLSAPPVLERALGLSYGPVIQATLDCLGRKALR